MMTAFQQHTYAMNRAMELGNPYSYVKYHILIDHQNKMKLMAILSARGL